MERNTKRMIPGLFGWLLALLVLVNLASAVNASEQIRLEFDNADQPRELHLSIGKSQILYSATPLDQVVIGNPAVADIKMISSRQVLILGNRPGRTNLVLRDDDRNLVGLLDVVVGYDLEAIKRKLHEVMPQERSIQVRSANDAVMLSGEVSSALALDSVLSITSSFVPAQKVINMLQVGGGQQVMVEVKIAEISRNATNEFGIGLEASDPGRFGYSHGVAATDVALNPVGETFNDLTSTFASMAVTGFTSRLTENISVRLRALEGKGLAKTLAEPNLVAMSGQEASFLAGGEFPYVSTSDLGTTNTIFKEFGVGLKFVPTVLNSERISLKLSAEVSSLGSEINGEIPISTRRASTTIEMADGQSFAIAGLLQNDIQNALNQVPGLGDVPVLGALFRSSGFKRQETELVIIVTPRLVMPVAAGQLKAPTDTFIPPNWVDMYLLGKLEGSIARTANASVQAGNAVAGPNGGLDGQYGHQVYDTAGEGGAVQSEETQNAQ